MLKLYYDKKKKCYAIKYNNMIEYFNHENNKNDYKNALACYELLRRLENENLL